MIEREELRELLDRIDVESLLDREGADYRRTHGSSGMQLNLKTCPVCGNSDWKVYVNAETGLGNCFGGSHPAGKNFSKYWLVRAFKECGHREAAEYIKQVALDFGWKPARKSEVVQERPTDWELPPSIPLPHNGKNLPYLTNRGFDSDITAYFHARYAPRNAFFKVKMGGEWIFQDHSQRIILPVFDMMGKLVTFQGRDTTGEAEKKYLFPPGLEGTGVHLYNGFNVKDTTRIIINEGAFDVWATKKAVDQDEDMRDLISVGTFGKHLSYGNEHDQLSKFALLRQQGVSEVTLMWDGEIRATDDAVLAARLLRDVGMTTRIAMLPKEKDPNEILPSEVRAAYYQAVSVKGTADELRVQMMRRKMNT